jgi:phosphoglycerate dehydrogenase-like enzyme
MKIWKNTSTLNGFDSGLIFTEEKKNAEIALLGSKSIELKEFPNLKAIFRAGIGKDNVPEEEAFKRKIEVCYPSAETASIIFEETAHFTCAQILRMLYNDIGSIESWTKYPRKQLKKKVLLIIGSGKIGSIVKVSMKPFMIVKTFDLISNTLDQLKPMMNIADCVTIHIPSSKQNINFINKEKLSWLKNKSILINNSRGHIVEERALYNELENNRLKSAFDVYWQEPYNGILKKFHPDSFYMTPHIASTCEDFLIGCKKDLDRLIVKYININ